MTNIDSIFNMLNAMTEYFVIPMGLVLGVAIFGFITKSISQAMGFNEQPTVTPEMYKKVEALEEQAKHVHGVGKEPQKVKDYSRCGYCGYRYGKKEERGSCPKCGGPRDGMTILQ